MAWTVINCLWIDVDNRSGVWCPGNTVQQLNFVTFFVVVVQLAEVALRQGWQGLFGCVELRRVLPTDAAAQRRNGPQRSEKNVWGCPAQLEAVHPSVISSTAHVNQLLLPRYFQIANVNQQKKKRQGALNVEEFIEFYHLLVVRPELDSLFRKYDPF